MNYFEIYIKIGCWTKFEETITQVEGKRVETFLFTLILIFPFFAFCQIG